MNHIYIPLALFVFAGAAYGNAIAESQQSYIKRYENQTKKVSPQEALINTAPEPDLDSGFVDLYNGQNLEGWFPLGGNCNFEARGEKIVGTVVTDSPSTYLTTIRDDYTDFIFTAELYWEVDSNSGIMFRAVRKPVKYGVTVEGPQVEMEGFGERGWSGGIYGQSAGGWFYPLWLEAHEEARAALKEGAWNRVTIYCKGSTVKTWVNGVPAAHWETDTYLEGFLSLQVHSGPKGEVHFRNIKIKELKQEWKDLFADGDFSQWTRFDGKPVSKDWSIEDGAIHRGGFKPGDIVTREDYDDFELEFEWKISERGNSGVKYRTRDRLGLEYQILDDDRHKDGNDPTHRTGSLYDLVAAPDNKPMHPVGQWNESRILANDGQIEHWLNGTKVVEIELSSVQWQESFENSKYRKHEGFGTWAGPILLQDHLDEVWYRNVLVREL